MMLSFKMALRSIGSNKLRSVLTMLGIIIGVMALVVLVSLVGGATDSVTAAVSGLGTNMLTVEIENPKNAPLDLQTVNGYMDQEDIGLVAPYLTGSVTAEANGNTGTLTAYGTTPALYEIQGMALSMGRFLKASDVQYRTYVCVISEATAQELFGYTDCVGEAVILDNVAHTVVGVLSDNTENLTDTLTSTSVVYLPYSAMLRLSDSLASPVTKFRVSAPEGKTMKDVEAAVTALLMERFDNDETAFTISSQNVLEDTMRTITSVLSLLLGGIAAISLVVGGIGIMNIMLVTVTERTREIGIRKAVGASRGNILTQFLMEAVVLCMIGCGLGIFLSWAILQMISTVFASLHISFTLNVGVVLAAVGFCFVIGVAFGLYPANKAAKMNPIDALQYGG